ncbi:MAG: oligoribonuclease [Candidatus Saccharibacteria bacterium]|nr:oligoribonuclease [Candidatus Saccharibacteria bacterium]
MTKQPKPQKILWIDLEMTGLDPATDEILEVAAIVTDWELREIASYEGVVRHDVAKLRQLLDRNAAFWDEHLEARRGLEAQNEQGEALATVEGKLLALIDEYMADEARLLLGGNSVHQDRRFIDQWWPRLSARLHYRLLDVSAWKVVFEGKYGKKFAKPEAHRALEDIRGSIQELRYYLKKVKV